MLGWVCSLFHLLYIKNEKHSHIWKQEKSYKISTRRPKFVGLWVVDLGTSLTIFKPKLRQNPLWNIFHIFQKKKQKKNPSYFGKWKLQKNSLKKCLIFFFFFFQFLNICLYIQTHCYIFFNDNANVFQNFIIFIKYIYIYIYIYPHTRVSSCPGLISVARVNE